MNVLVALTCVIAMQIVSILRGVTRALATLDIKAMDFLAQVSTYIFQSECINSYIIFYTHVLDINECLSSNGGCHHNCHDSDGSYLCSCNNGYQLNSDGHTCEGW